MSSSSIRKRRGDTLRMETVRLELEQFRIFIHPHSMLDRLDFVLPFAEDPCPQVRRIMLEFVAEHVEREPGLIPTGLRILESLWDSEDELDPELVELGRKMIRPVPEWLGSAAEPTREMLEVKQRCEKMAAKIATRKSDVVRMLGMPAPKLETKLRRKPERRLRLIRELRGMANESLRKRALFLTFLRKHRGGFDLEFVGS